MADRGARDESTSSALFSGLVFCTSGLKVPERDPLFALARRHGAETQVYLDDAVTHLLLREPEGAKYEFASDRRDRMCTVLPDWVHACLKQNFLVPETEFYVGRQVEGVQPHFESETAPGVCSKSWAMLSRGSSARNPGFRENMMVGVESESVHVFRGCVFVFSGYDQEDLTEITNKLLAIDGVRVVDETCMDEATHCIARYAEFGSRSVYRRAVVGGKVIATWYWLSACLREGGLLEIGAHPLYAPIPNTHGIEGMENLIISVTGFVGGQRDLVKDMIHATGAAYTGSCFRENTHLVAQAPEGRKYESAVVWGMKIVSVGWLEKCIREWSYVSEVDFLFDRAPVEAATICDESVPAREKDKHSEDLRSAATEFVENASAVTVSAVRKLDSTTSIRRVEPAVPTHSGFGPLESTAAVGGQVEQEVSVRPSVPEKVSERKRGASTARVPSKKHRTGMDSDATARAPGRSFVFSVRDTATRRRWARAVKSLGGVVLTDAPAAPTNSPVSYLFPSLRRTVKFVCACFNGDLILPANYILESAKAGSFLPQEDFSWSRPEYRGDVHADIWPGACDRWRRRRGLPRPLAGWNVGIYGQTAPDPSDVERMLVMGGAQVLATKPPYRTSALTHVIVAQDMRKDSVVEQFLEAGVKLLHPAYLMDLASREHDPDLRMYNLWK